MSAKRAFPLVASDIYIAGLSGKNMGVPASSPLEEAFFLMVRDEPDLARETLFYFMRWVESQIINKVLHTQSHASSDNASAAGMIPFNAYANDVAARLAATERDLNTMSSDPWAYFTVDKPGFLGEGDPIARAVYMKASSRLSQAVVDESLHPGAQNLFMAKLALSLKIKNETYFSYLDEGLYYLRTAYGLSFWENDLEHYKESLRRFQEWNAATAAELARTPAQVAMKAGQQARDVIHNDALMDHYFHQAMTAAINAYHAGMLTPGGPLTLQ